MTVFSDFTFDIVDADTYHLVIIFILNQLLFHSDLKCDGKAIKVHEIIAAFLFCIYFQIRWFRMTAFTFFGCALTAYGTPLSLFLITICSDPVKIIILILSAFFWLLSLLLSAILWTAVVPLKVMNG